MSIWLDYVVFADCRDHMFTVEQGQGSLADELCAVEAHPSEPGRARLFR